MVEDWNFLRWDVFSIAQDRVSLCSPGWHGFHTAPPASSPPRREEPRGAPPGPDVFFLCPCSGKACPQKQHALLTSEKQLSFEVLHFVKCMPSSEEKVIPGDSPSFPCMEKDNPNLRPVECSPCDLNATEETSKNNALFHPQGVPVECK